MPSLTIKGIPDDVLNRLREKARTERRSLTQQVLVMLERGLESDAQLRTDRVSEQVEVWRRLAGGWVSDESVSAETDRIYRARTAGRDVEL